MINFDDVTKENIKKHSLNWPQISDYSYKILIVRGSTFWKDKKKFLNKSATRY